MANQFPNSLLSGTAVPAPSPFSPSASRPFTLSASAQAPASPKTPPKRKLAHPCYWPGCDRMLSCPHNVEQHVREAHTGEKPFECTHCDKAFARPYTLYRHLRGKHGILDAAPGRGKGGGLERIGLQGVQKKRGRVGGKGAGTMGGDVGGRFASGVVARDHGSDGRQLDYPQQQQQLPLAETEMERPVVEVNNFAPIPTACACGEQFDNREALLAHLHEDHGQPPSAHCNCMLCLGTSGGSVDGGEHACEEGAASFKGLIADEPPTDANVVKKCGLSLSGTATPTSNDSSADTDSPLAQALRRVGLTEEQFTANMPKPVDSPMQPTPLLLDAETEARFTANMPKPVGPPPVPYFPGAGQKGTPEFRAGCWGEHG